jgi:hypothetical protein
VRRAWPANSYDLALMKIVRAVGLFASAAFAQMVIGPEQIPCREEVVRSDFERKGKIQVSGELKDLSGAQFVNWKIVLKRANQKEKFVLYRAISTISANKHGHFDLGVGDVDRYRFPLAPKRGFQQPVRVLCREGRDGEINLVLRANPTVGRLSYSITNAQTH